MSEAPTSTPIKDLEVTIEKRISANNESRNKANKNSLLRLTRKLLIEKNQEDGFLQWFLFPS